MVASQRQHPVQGFPFSAGDTETWVAQPQLSEQPLSFQGCQGEQGGLVCCVLPSHHILGLKGRHVLTTWKSCMKSRWKVPEVEVFEVLPGS